MSKLNIIVGKKAHTKKLVDQGSGVEIEFSYRLPTNPERMQYQRKAIKVKGRKTVIKSSAAARELVQPLITGFKFPTPDLDTQIRWEDSQGQFQALSCVAGDPGYHEDWKEGLTQAVPGMIETLGNLIFAGVVDGEGSVEFGYEDEEEVEAETDRPQ